MEPFTHARRRRRAASPCRTSTPTRSSRRASCSAAAATAAATSLFHDLRFDDDGAPKPDFVLNRPAYRDARDPGRASATSAAARRASTRCGRSCDYGFRAVIAPSFGDIFLNNCFKNGLLPIVLPAERVTALLTTLEREPGAHSRSISPRRRSTGPTASSTASTSIRFARNACSPASTIFPSRSPFATRSRPSRRNMKPVFPGGPPAGVTAQEIRCDDASSSS